MCMQFFEVNEKLKYTFYYLGYFQNIYKFEK